MGERPTRERMQAGIRRELEGFGDALMPGLAAMSERKQDVCPRCEGVGHVDARRPVFEPLRRKLGYWPVVTPCPICGDPGKQQSSTGENVMSKEFYLLERILELHNTPGEAKEELMREIASYVEAASKTKQVVRKITYVGPEAWLKLTLNKSLPDGIRWIDQTKGTYIKVETLVGLPPEDSSNESKQ